jgi:hypothetical protein
MPTLFHLEPSAEKNQPERKTNEREIIHPRTEGEKDLGQVPKGARATAGMAPSWKAKFFFVVLLF